MHFVVTGCMLSDPAVSLISPSLSRENVLELGLGPAFVITILMSAYQRVRPLLRLDHVIGIDLIMLHVRVRLFKTSVSWSRLMVR